jgi:hypothetical protein
MAPILNRGKPKVPCLEVLWDLSSTEMERSRQKLRAAGSIAAAHSLWPRLLLMGSAALGPQDPQGVGL